MNALEIFRQANHAINGVARLKRMSRAVRYNSIFIKFNSKPIGISRLSSVTTFASQRAIISIIGDIDI